MINFYVFDTCMLLRIMYLLFTTKCDFCFFSAVYGIWNFTISVHFDKILKTFDEKNNINLSMLSETYLGKCNFFLKILLSKK